MHKSHHHEINECCILCENTNLSKLDTVNVNTIVSLYRKQFNIDITPEVYPHKRISLFRCPQCDLRFFLPAITGSSNLYEVLQKIDWYYQEYKKEYNYCSRFTRNKKILEIGCGEGFFFQHSKAAVYKGIEFNKQAIDSCCTMGLDVEKTNIQEMSKLHPNEYDVVCSFQVLEHVKNPLRFIQDALASLKKHGLLMLSVPSEDSFVSFARNNILNMPPHHITRWPDSSFRYISKTLGLKLLEIHHGELEPIHYDWYSSVLGQQIIKRWTRQTNQKLFDQTLADKISSKTGSLLGLFLKKTITQKRFLPKGHTVTAVFEKL